MRPARTLPSDEPALAWDALLADERFQRSRSLPADQVLALLQTGTIQLFGLIPWSSNYTFLVTVTAGDETALAIYKPRRGERPLWDFPDGTLCQRERAAYLVSVALGWPAIPPTVLRDAELGPGSVQLLVDADPEAHYFTFRGQLVPTEQRIALFDFVVNNADRKGGHCLRGKGGQVWCLDHGLCFHEDYKLRTVIWDYAGQPIPPPMLDDLNRLKAQLEIREQGAGSRPGGSPAGEWGGPVQPDGESDLVASLREVITPNEIAALKQRLDILLTTKRFPLPGPGRNVPWPLI